MNVKEASSGFARWIAVAAISILAMMAAAQLAMSETPDPPPVRQGLPTAGPNAAVPADRGSISVARMRLTGYGAKDMLEVNWSMDGFAPGILISSTHPITLNGRPTTVQEVYDRWKSMTVYPWMSLDWRRSDNSYHFQEIRPDPPRVTGVGPNVPVIRYVQPTVGVSAPAPFFQTQLQSSPPVPYTTLPTTVPVVGVSSDTPQVGPLGLVHTLTPVRRVGLRGITSGAGCSSFG